MELPIYVVDSFSSVPFRGNPAAVCLDSSPQGLADDQMQKVAAEMNISETAFVRRLSEEDSFEKSDHFALRWFSPACEVPLCGHATLATAAVIFKVLGNPSAHLDFKTLQSGHLSASKSGEFIKLQLPLNSPSPVEDLTPLEPLIKAVLGDIKPIDVQYAPAPMRKLLLRLPDSMTRADLEALQPPISTFTSIHDGDLVRGVIITRKADSSDLSYDFTSRYFAPWVAIPEDPVTAQLEALTPAVDKFISLAPQPFVGVIATLRTSETYDFVSRFFAPWIGINEDPVTGAAHTVLAGYWSKILDKKELSARQCSKRGGDLHIVVHEDQKMIDLAGPATIFLKGSFTI